MKDLSKKKSTKPTLFFFYLSKNIIWSIFLILKEEKEFPRLVFIEVENIDSKYISMDTHKNKLLNKNTLLFFFIMFAAFFLRIYNLNFENLEIIRHD